MSRVLFVVAAFLCIALSCAAQKSELQCGDGRCAVTLDDAPTNEDQKKKIAELKKKRSSANAQVGHLAQYIHTFTDNCVKAEASSDDVQQAEASIQGYVNTTEEYLQKFTGLNVDQGLQRMNDAVQILPDQYNRTLAAKDEVCAYKEQFSEKRGELFQTLDTIDAELKALETKFSEEVFDKIKEDSDKLKKQAEDLQNEAKQKERPILRKTSFVEETGAAAEELRVEMYSVFQGIEREYTKCNDEFKSRSRHLPFRKPGDPDPSEAVRLQICQKKKEENAENSKKAEDEESKKTEPPATKNPQPTLKPNADAQSTSSENDKNNNEKDDNKKGEQNDGAARHAVLQNAFFVCLFVAGLSVLTTA